MVRIHQLLVPHCNTSDYKSNYMPMTMPHVIFGRDLLKNMAMRKEQRNTQLHTQVQT